MELRASMPYRTGSHERRLLVGCELAALIRSAITGDGMATALAIEGIPKKGILATRRSVSAGEYPDPMIPKSRHALEGSQRSLARLPKQR